MKSKPNKLYEVQTMFLDTVLLSLGLCDFDLIEVVRNCFRVRVPYNDALYTSHYNSLIIVKYKYVCKQGTSE